MEIMGIHFGRSRSAIAFPVLFGFLCSGTPAIAYALEVDSKASGYFGGYARTVDDTSLPLVEAYVFDAPGVIEIVATGAVDLHPDYSILRGVGPKGVTLPRGTSGCHMPLEEELVDARGYSALSARMERGGALFGAFVPKPIVDKTGFQPINEDFPGGGITSDRLFFVGERRDFTAQEPGTLFLGVNDCRPYNNSGSFSVTITEK